MNIGSFIITLSIFLKLAKGLTETLPEQSPIRSLHIPVVVLDCRTRLQDTNAVRNSGLGILELSAAVSTMI